MPTSASAVSSFTFAAIAFHVPTMLFRNRSDDGHRKTPLQKEKEWFWELSEVQKLDSAYISQARRTFAAGYV